MANFLRKIVKSKSRSKSPVKQYKTIVPFNLNTQNNKILPINNFCNSNQSNLHQNKIHSHQIHSNQHYLVTNPNDRICKTYEYKNGNYDKKKTLLNNYLSECIYPSKNQIYFDNEDTDENLEDDTKLSLKILPHYKKNLPILSNFSSQNYVVDNDFEKINKTYIDDSTCNNSLIMPDNYSSLPSSNFKKLDQIHRSPTQISPNYLSNTEKSLLRPRSASPKKNISTDYQKEKKNTTKLSKKQSLKTLSISKTLDYLHPQCKSEGCFATIIVQNTQFLLCKYQLAHVSDFFRNLFLNNSAFPIKGVKQFSANTYKIAVSDFNNPPKSLQFQWFIECTIPCPILKSITDNLLETCMRLSKRFSAKKLELRSARFIQKNVENKPPMMALCWLNWVYKHHFDRATREICLPVVARLPLFVIEKHRRMLPEKVIVDLIAMKLRTSYQQAAKAFYTIHKIDHFFVEMEKCPRCGRQREKGKVRVYGNPCQKLIGCERCTKEFACELEQKSDSEFEAFYQCEHGFWPLNDRTEDCHCQALLYKNNFNIQSSARIIQSNQTIRSFRNNNENNNTPLLLSPILNSEKKHENKTFSNLGAQDNIKNKGLFTSKINSILNEKSRNSS